MERLPNTSIPSDVGSSDVTTTTRTLSTSVFLPTQPEGVDQESGGGGGVTVTTQEMGSSTSTEDMSTTSTTSVTIAGTDNFTEFTVWSEDFWNSSTPTPTISLLVTSNISLGNDTNVSVVTSYIPGDDEPKYCVEWEAAQHNLFQTANLFFAAAFIVPRSFKQSLLLLR